MSFYEWAAITFAVLSTTCIAGFVISHVAPRVGVDLVWADVVEFRFADGEIILSDSLVNQELLDGWLASPDAPDVEFDFHVPVPGSRVRWTSFSDFSTSWYVKLSTLLLFVIFALLAVLCFHLYRKQQRQGRSGGRISLNSKRIAHFW